MKLIIGLGNPGTKYNKTRHNLGWLFLDYLAGKNKWQKSVKAKAEYYQIEIAGEEVELLKPLTFMNNSGAAVNYKIKKHHLKLSDIIVVHDDKDLDFGRIKWTNSSSSAGHNGVQSIINALGSQDFARLRLGVKDELLEKMPTDKFILGKFLPAEIKGLPDFLAQAESLLLDKIK